MKTLFLTVSLQAFILASPVLAGLTLPQTRQAAAEIDGALADFWKAQKVTPNAAVSDEVFLRRIYLDLAGRIPNPTECQTFLQSTQSDKRAALIRQLLQQESYVSHFYNYWADVLRFKSYFVNTANVIPAAYGQFLKESLRTNKPYDQFVREMLAAKGYAWDNPAVGYYQRDPGMPLDNMAITSRIFLGTRIECAQCHDHPFDKWKQSDFYHLAAYTHSNNSINEAFEGARAAIKKREDVIQEQFQQERKGAADGGKAAEARRKERLEAMQYRRVVNIIKDCVGQLFSPIGLQRKPESVLKLPHDYKYDDAKPFDVMAPATLMGDAAPMISGKDSADVFAQWVTSSKNPRFTKVIVNRLWKKMFGLPLNERYDDLRDDSQAMIPELEKHLEKLMITLRYDMKDFLGIIASTKAYQSTASAEAFTPGTVYPFTGPVLRRMSAEQIWDSLVALNAYEPDAHDSKREAIDARRIAISQMACDAYLNFDGDALVDKAYATLAAENDFQSRQTVIREAMIVAKRGGDTARVRELGQKDNQITEERARNLVNQFIMPVLTQLAQQKGGKEAKPVIDASYKMNPNARVFTTETWRRLYIPGYGPGPKTAEQQQAESAASDKALADLATRLGVPEAQRKDFFAWCRDANAGWLRASEMESPAPRGHPLRTLGQSDRDFVENANLSAAIPQALMLMNSDLISEKGMLSPWSPLMRFIQQAKTPEARVDAVYLALLSRKPSAEERAIWDKAVQSQGLSKIEDLVFALLNTKQFIFIQ